MKIKEQECQVGKIATIHRGVLTEKLVIFTHLFAAATHTAQAHTCTYIHITEYIHGLHLHTVGSTVSPPCGGGGNY